MTGTIGTIVFVNGFIFHVCAAIDCGIVANAKQWDIICNIGLACYVNVTTVWVQTHILTIVALVMWQMNNLNGKSPLVHAFGVQLPLFLSLFLYHDETS